MFLIQIVIYKLKSSEHSGLQICTSGFEPYFAYPEEPGYPAIENHGGTVVGNNGAAQGYPAGTKIPPTKVDIIRPEDLRK